MEHEGGMKYRRFLAMIATSTAVMFGLMYLNTYALDHVFFSQTRFWMAFVMGAAMAVIMLSFMLGMYRDTKKNVLIYVGSMVIFFGALWLVRSQRTVDDVAYMKAMIPHHSIAIMTSERANIRDAGTRELAKAIITAQRREIAEMKYLISRIEEHGMRTTSEAEPDPPPAEVMSAGSALDGVSTGLLMPEVMTDADMTNFPGTGERCVFRMTGVGLPVFVYGSTGVVRLNGKLIPLPWTGDGRYAADGVSATIRPLDDDPEDGTVFEAELVLRLPGAPNELGFHGFSEC